MATTIKVSIIENSEKNLVSVEENSQRIIVNISDIIEPDIVVGGGDVDGGNANSIYLVSQIVDGGVANNMSPVLRTIDGGNA